MLHGIGKHDPQWGDELKAQLLETAENLTDDAATGFIKQNLVNALQEVQFVSLIYDELYQQKVADWIRQGGDVIKALPAGALERVEGVLGSKQAATDFVKDNLTDLLIYCTMPEFRAFTRNHIALQMEKTILQAGMDSSQVRYFLLAHSMGTAVAHDTLAQMSTTPGSPLQGGIFKFDALFQLSNTSALLKREYDPRTSTVRLYNDPNKPNCVRNYVDVAHKWDPVCQVLPYQNHMIGVENFDRYGIIAPNKILAMNIHAISHYLQFPAVYMMIYRLLFGDIVPKAYFEKKSQEQPASEAEQRVVETVKAISEGHLGDAADNLAKLVTLIAELFKNGVTL
jgi:hypothetical protein